MTLLWDSQNKIFNKIVQNFDLAGQIEEKKVENWVETKKGYTIKICNF